jgi:hypothetical protein
METKETASTSSEPKPSEKPSENEEDKVFIPVVEGQVNTHTFTKTPLRVWSAAWQQQGLIVGLGSHGCR